MKIEFTDTEYRFVSGHAPKGWGYWGFTFAGGMTFWTTGTLTEAKKACKAYVKECAPADHVGTVMVKILP